MKEKEIEEIEYLPLPLKEAGEDSVTTLIKRLATVVRRWSCEELSGRQNILEDKIDF